MSNIDSELDNLLQSLGDAGARPKATTAAGPAGGAAKKPEVRQTVKIDNELDALMSSLGGTGSGGGGGGGGGGASGRGGNAAAHTAISGSSDIDAELASLYGAKGSRGKTSVAQPAQQPVRESKAWERTTAAENELSELMASLSAGMGPASPKPAAAAAAAAPAASAPAPTPAPAPAKTAATPAPASASASAAAPVGLPPVPTAQVPIHIQTGGGAAAAAAPVKQQQAAAPAAAKPTPAAAVPVAAVAAATAAAVVATPPKDDELDDLMSELTAGGGSPVMAAKASPVAAKPAAAPAPAPAPVQAAAAAPTQAPAPAAAAAGGGTLGAGLADLMSQLDADIATTAPAAAAAAAKPAPAATAAAAGGGGGGGGGAVSSQLGNLLDDLMGMETSVPDMPDAVAMTTTTQGGPGVGGADEDEAEPEPEKPQLPALPATPGVCGCGQAVVAGQFLSALDRKWHPPHFSCFKCGCTLVGVKFFQFEGRPLCEKDYREIFSPRCPGCSNAVVGPCVNAVKKTYHQECFRCKNCKRDFAGGQFFPKGRHIYCQECFQTGFVPQCGRCQQLIYGEMVSALGKNWHIGACFVCKTCSQPFRDGTYYEGGDGFPYCQRCYVVASNLVCAVCTNPVEGRAIAAGDKRYHKPCFKCNECSVELIGMPFRPRVQGNQQELYCQRCYDKLFD